jgi:uncharacterized protein (TIGR02453 family)
MRDPIPSSALLKDIPPFAGFPKEGQRFLAGLALHNEKVWFDAHRAEYETHLLAPLRAFVLDAGGRLQKKIPRLQADPRVGGSLFRIARDTRFSSNKAPYKTHAAARMWDGTGPGKDTSAGFYVHIDVESVYVGGGLYLFEDDQLERFRRALQDPKTLASLKRVLAKLGGLGVSGQALKRYPKGFDATHPAGELALFKGLYAGTELDLRVARSAKALDAAVKVYETIVPLNAWLMRHLVVGPTATGAGER